MPSKITTESDRTNDGWLVVQLLWNSDLWMEVHSSSFSAYAVLVDDDKKTGKQLCSALVRLLLLLLCFVAVCPIWFPGEDAPPTVRRWISHINHCNVADGDDDHYYHRQQNNNYLPLVLNSPVHHHHHHQHRLTVIDHVSVAVSSPPPRHHALMIAS